MADKTSTDPATCEGPLVWFDTLCRMHGTPCGAAVLECAACGYIVTTGNFHDDAHAYTPVMQEGLAA